MRFYSLYSKAQKRFNPPFIAHDDMDAVDRVSKMVSAANDIPLMNSLDDLQLCCVACWDPNVELGESPLFFSGVSKVVVMNDLHKNLPLPPSIKECLDKFYGGVENNA